MRTMLSTRRQFLTASAALPFALRAMAKEYSAPQWVFLGTDKGKGIYRVRWDTATGELGAVELAVESERPDFFAKHPRLPVMYTVNSMGGGKGGVSGYRIDKTSGALTLINRVSSHGDAPCAVSVTPDGMTAFVANYTDGTVASYNVDPENGSLHDNSSFDCRNNPVCGALGPVKDRQDAAHMHCVTVSPNERFMLSCNLGEDALEMFLLKKQGDITAGQIRIPARAGSGPRHIVFHPTRKWLYCIHELDCTVDMYLWDVSGGVGRMQLIESSVVSTLSKGTPLKGNTGCEISISDDGRFVYTCSRGVDEIVVYRVDQSKGFLTEQQRVSSGGKVPRYFTLDPSRKWLVCCNQGAGKTPVGNVTVFAHDAATGRISDKPKTFAADTPMFTLFV